MKKFRALLCAIAMIVALSCAPVLVSAQGGASVFTGRVTIDGAPAPANTRVQLSLQATGALVGESLTGSSGLAADQYRIDVQSTGVQPNATLEFSLEGVVTTEKPTATFVANFVIITQLDFISGTPTPVPTATPVPPTATAVPPTATPTVVPPTATAVPSTATPAPPPTASPSPIPPTASPMPTATAPPAATPTALIMNLIGYQAALAGTNYRLQLEIVQPRGLIAIKGALAYSPEKFEFVEAAGGRGSRKGDQISIYVLRPGHIEFSFERSEGLDRSTPIVELSFTTVGPAGEVGDFEVRDLSAVNADRQEIVVAARTVPKVVLIPHATKGDVNEDGKIRVDDVLRTLMAIVGSGSLTDTQAIAADVAPMPVSPRISGTCGDGEINLQDAMIILRATTGIVDLGACNASAR